MRGKVNAGRQMAITTDRKTLLKISLASDVWTSYFGHQINSLGVKMLNYWSPQAQQFKDLDQLELIGSQKQLILKQNLQEMTKLN